MEQAGNQLINTIISRQKQLEGDVSFIKREQCAHSNQIETLAIEVQEIHHEIGDIHQELGRVHQKIDSMQGPINKINKLDHEMSTLKQDVKLILEALAIKY